MAQRFRLLLPLALAALSCAGVANAEIGASAALFRSGREAYREGNFELARERFEESERLEPAVGTELNLGLCDEQLGHLLAAWRLYQMALDKLSSSDPRADIARHHAEQLARRLPQVTLMAGPDLPMSAEIVIGSTKLTRSGLGTPLPMDVGTAAFVVNAPGRLPRRYELQLDEGARTTLVLEPGAPEPRTRPAPAQSASMHTARDDGARRTWGIVSIGAGASLVTAGAVAGLQVLQAKAAVKRECDANYACTADGVAIAHRGDRLATLSTVAFGLGAGFGAVGIWLLAFESTSRESKASEVGLSVSANGVVLGGEFQ